MPQNTVIVSVSDGEGMDLVCRRKMTVSRKRRILAVVVLAVEACQERTLTAYPKKCHVHQLLLLFHVDAVAW
jgi:hypothetical protein